VGLLDQVIACGVHTRTFTRMTPPREVLRLGAVHVETGNFTGWDQAVRAVWTGTEAPEAFVLTASWSSPALSGERTVLGHTSESPDEQSIPVGVPDEGV